MASSSEAGTPNRCWAALAALVIVRGLAAECAAAPALAGMQRVPKAATAPTVSSVLSVGVLAMETRPNLARNCRNVA